MEVKSKTTEKKGRMGGRKQLSIPTNVFHSAPGPPLRYHRLHHLGVSERTSERDWACCACPGILIGAAPSLQYPTIASLFHPNDRNRAHYCDPAPLVADLTPRH